MRVIDKIYTIELSQIEINTIVNAIGTSHHLYRIAEYAKGPVMENIDELLKKLETLEADLDKSMYSLPEVKSVIEIRNLSVKPHAELSGLYVIEYKANYGDTFIDGGIFTDNLNEWAKDALYQTQAHVKNKLGVGKILPCEFEGLSHDKTIAKMEEVVRECRIK